MLQNDFFTILSWSREEDSFKVCLEINAGHAIFEGHFPGQPVVPGACLLQMVKEVAEKIMDRVLRLQKADHLKFIALIDPSADNVLEMEITIRIKEREQVNISASLLNKGAVCFKFNGVFGGPGANSTPL